ncbi:MAG: addiction module protein [Polaromonas sp.]
MQNLQTTSNGVTLKLGELPPIVAKELGKSTNPARRAAKILEQWAEDAADARIAQRRLRDLQSGKTQAIPAAEVYKKLGI